MASEERWDAAAIADGILTWHMWPGFQGVHCDECGCEMNVMGMSYGHRCPDCDPDEDVMHSMHDHGMMPFDEPRFGPTRATIRRGGQLADEISESKRLFVLGQRVLVQDGSGYRRGPVQTGTVVSLEPSSWPGMRWYRVDIDGGREKQHTYESDMAPLRKFADGDMVSVRHRDEWVPARIVGLVNPEESHLLYRHHWYKVEVLAETDLSVNGAETVSSMVHESVFNGNVREEDIRRRDASEDVRRVNPDCRWCGGTGEVTLASTTRECLDCWPDRVSGVPAECQEIVMAPQDGADPQSGDKAASESEPGWEAHAKAERDRWLASIFR